MTANTYLPTSRLKLPSTMPSAVSASVNVADVSTSYSYNRVNVNINGVVKSVLVPMDASQPHKSSTTTDAATAASSAVSTVILVQQSNAAACTGIRRGRGRPPLPSAAYSFSGERTIHKTLTVPAKQLITICPATTCNARPMPRIPVQTAISRSAATAVPAALKQLQPGVFHALVPRIPRQPVILRPVVRVIQPLIAPFAATAPVSSISSQGFRRAPFRSGTVTSTSPDQAVAMTQSSSTGLTGAVSGCVSQNIRAMLISKLTTVPLQRNVSNDALHVISRSAVGQQVAVVSSATAAASVTSCPSSASSSAGASCPPTVIVNARTMTTEEAAAVGWTKPQSSLGTLYNLSGMSQDNEQPHGNFVAPVGYASVDASIDALPRADYSAVAAESELGSPTEVVSSSAFAQLDDTAMKVIEIFPDDDVDYSVDIVERDSKDWLKFGTGFTDRSLTNDDNNQKSFPSSRRVNDANQLQDGASTAETTRPASTTSTDTAYSDEMEQAPHSRKELHDCDVLAEWWENGLQKQLMVGARKVVTSESTRRPLPRRRKRRRRRLKAHQPSSANVTTSPGASKSVSSGRVNKARRTAGRPLSSAMRLGIRECFVSLERLTLRHGVTSVYNKIYWKFVCCRNRHWKKTVPWDARALGRQGFAVERGRLQSAETVTPVTANSLGESCSDEVSFAELTSENAGLLEPSFVESKSITVAQMFRNVKPTQVATAAASAAYHGTSGLPMTGSVPLLMRNPTRVMVARPASGSSNIKDRYLLVRTRTGSYLVSMDDGGTGKTANVVAELIRAHHQQQQSAAASAPTGTTVPGSYALSSLQGVCASVPVNARTVEPLPRIKQEVRPLGEAIVEKSNTAYPTSRLPTEQKSFDSNGGAADVDPLLLSRGRPARRPRKNTAEFSKTVSAAVTTAANRDSTASNGAHRERIELLKMRLRQEEERLNEIRRQQEATRAEADVDLDTELI